MQWRTQEKISGGQGRVSGARRPPDAGEFSKICKKFLKKIAKNAVFSPILQKNSKACGRFLRVSTKITIVWEILREFWKFLIKIQWKNWIFLYFLGTFVAKSRNFGNNIIFLHQFFPVWGGVSNPLTPTPPRYTTDYVYTIKMYYSAAAERKKGIKFLLFKMYWVPMRSWLWVRSGCGKYEPGFTDILKT